MTKNRVFTINRTAKQRHVLVYALASIFDGIVMLLTFGQVISSARSETSLWMARRSCIDRSRAKEKPLNGSINE